MSKKRRNTDPDPPREVVLAEDLARFLQAALAPALEAYETGDSHLGPYANLAAMSGIPERRIYGILNGENCTVDLDYADRLLLALGYFIELELPDAIVPEYDAKLATLEQTQMMRQWARARGRVWPTDRQGMRTEPIRIRKEVWAAERTQHVA